MVTIANFIYPSVLKILQIKRLPWLGLKRVLWAFWDWMLNNKWKLNDDKTEEADKYVTCYGCAIRHPK